MITLNKINYDSIPEAVAKTILNWTPDHIDIDDSKATPIQLAKLKAFFAVLGYN